MISPQNIKKYTYLLSRINTEKHFWKRFCMCRNTTENSAATSAGLWNWAASCIYTCRKLQQALRCSKHAERQFCTQAHGADKCS